MFFSKVSFKRINFRDIDLAIELRQEEYLISYMINKSHWLDRPDYVNSHHGAAATATKTCRTRTGLRRYFCGPIKNHHVASFSLARNTVHIGIHVAIKTIQRFFLYILI